MSDPFRVKPGKKFKLKDRDSADTGGLESKKEGKERLEKGTKRMHELQERLYAQDRYSLLLIFQAMDAAGKDSTIEHVMSGVNPQGCQVYSFKQPSSEELDHDFLWRTNRCLPERGRIGIFNRSYYEEVLIVRVHQQILDGQRLPSQVVTPDIWKERYQDINAMERYLSRQGTVIRKFFLHVSKEEQKKRFLARLDEPEKNWKFSVADAKERQHWDRYMEAYEDAIEATSSDEAPWYVIPADHKWFMRMAVAEVIVQTLESLDLEFPVLSDEKRNELAQARKLLEEEKG
jgi:PPK2 family polyphosphate:nucleotide phosphotransferase